MRQTQIERNEFEWAWLIRRIYFINRGLDWHQHFRFHNKRLIGLYCVIDIYL